MIFKVFDSGGRPDGDAFGKRLAETGSAETTADSVRGESKRAEAERLRREVDAVNARLPEGLIFGFGRLDELEAEKAAEGGGPD